MYIHCIRSELYSWPKSGRPAAMHFSAMISPAESAITIATQWTWDCDDMWNVSWDAAGPVRRPRARRATTARAAWI